MNKVIEQFARSEIKAGLIKCPSEWQIMFKRMYSHLDLNKDINKVVDDMPREKLDWALSQVQSSVKKLATSSRPEKEGKDD